MPKHVQTQRIPVTLAERPHPFPSRTRKLSSPAPKILRGQPFGKIGRRRDFCVSGNWSGAGCRARLSGGRQSRPVSCPHDPGREGDPPADRPSPHRASRYLSFPPRRERLAQCLAGEGASLPGGGQRRPPFRREEAAVPDRRAQDVSRVCNRAGPWEIGWATERTGGRYPGGRIPGWPQSCSTMATDWFRRARGRPRSSGRPSSPAPMVRVRGQSPSPDFGRG